MAARRRPLLAALLLIAALAGCSNPASGVLANDREAEPNATDAAFARAMLAHERTIGSIARIGHKKALREELRAIAGKTVAHEDRDTRWLPHLADELRRRGVSPRGGNIGEAPPFDPRGLRRAVSIDHEFMRRMIEQHEFAIRTAATERAHGRDRRLKALARTVHESSRRDLATLRRWLRTWYGDDTQRGLPPLPPPGGGGGSDPGPPV